MENTCWRSTNQQQQTNAKRKDERARRNENSPKNGNLMHKYIPTWRCTVSQSIDIKSRTIVPPMFLLHRFFGKYTKYHRENGIESETVSGYKIVANAMFLIEIETERALNTWMFSGVSSGVVWCDAVINCAMLAAAMALFLSLLSLSPLLLSSILVLLLDSSRTTERDANNQEYFI